MAASTSLETSLGGIFSKGPKLSETSRRSVVSWVPWLDLAVGLFSLLATYWLWHWAHAASVLTDYVNQINAFYGTAPVRGNYMTTSVWIAFIVILLEAVLFLAAFPGLKARRKSSWNLVFYASLINVAYGVVLLFTNYGGVGAFLGCLIGSAFCFWLLFQIRPAYK